MPRTPLTPRSGNILKRKELTPYERGRIVGKAEEGASPAEIARCLKIPDSTVRDTISNDATRNEGNSKLRSSTPKSYSPYERMRLLRLARSNPQYTYADLKKLSGVKCCTSTIRSILKDVSITN